jgi:hypothetical protein
MYNKNQSPYEYYLELTNKTDQLEQIKKFIIDLEILYPDHNEHFKTIRSLCNGEINKLQESIDFLCSDE